MIMKSTLKTLVTLAGTAVFSLTAMTLMAQAADEWEAKSRMVQLADLDLTKPEGVDALFKRLKGAAQEVCRPLLGEQLRPKQSYQVCIGFALSNAVARIDRPVLTDYVLNRAKKKPAVPPARMVSQR
jgi:UrcA family protein